MRGEGLRVDPERLLEASRFVAGKAQELRERLDKLDGTIGQRLLAEGWRGKAAKGYDGSWTDWKTGAAEMVSALDESSTKLAEAANTYVSQDDENRGDFLRLTLPDTEGRA